VKLRIRHPRNAANDSFTRKDVVHDIVAPMPHEGMKGQRFRNDRRSHQAVWPERRDEVLTRFAHSVLKFLEPIGYTGVTADNADLTDISKSQCIIHRYEHRMWSECVTADIAPEWLRLQANGIDCVSLYSEYVDADGAVFDLSDDAEENVLMAERMASEAIAQQLDANTEEFLRQSDRNLWYSTRPKAAVEVLSEDGRRGVVPKANHPWTAEQLKALMPHMLPVDDLKVAIARRGSTWFAKERSLRGVRALLTTNELRAARDWEPDRRFLENHSGDTAGFIEQANNDRYEAVEGKPYPAGEECPNCFDGTIIDPDTEDEMDCPICHGTSQVLPVLGMDGMPVSDPTEPTPPEHHPPSDAFIDLLTSHIAH